MKKFLMKRVSLNAKWNWQGDGMKRHETASGKKPKVSEMILKMAEGFLDMGKDMEHRENLLRMACMAWNIACFEAPRRRSLIDKYIATFKEVNNASEEACKNLEGDMGQLIEEKDRLYPQVLIRILDAKIESIEGREHVVVTSTPFV
jgi:hypothetical protein